MYEEAAGETIDVLPVGALQTRSVPGWSVDLGDGPDAALWPMARTMMADYEPLIDQVKELVDYAERADPKGQNLAAYRAAQIAGRFNEVSQVVLQIYVDNLEPSMEALGDHELSAIAWQRWQAWFSLSSVMVSETFAPCIEAASGRRGWLPKPRYFLESVLTDMCRIREALHTKLPTLVRDQRSPRSTLAP